MARKGRKIAMIIDNCPAHSKVNGLQAIELVFLPPNTTSKTQPMDQGVIQSLKCHYRKRVIYTLLRHIETKTDLKINVFQALEMLQQVWSSVTLVTIQKCYRHVGFILSKGDTQSDEILTKADPDNYIHFAQLATLGLTEITMSAFISVDNNIQTSTDVINESII